MLNKEMALHFNQIILSGVNAIGFAELFDTAFEFQKSNPDFHVKFEFNGQLIEVNNYTVDSAWNTYLAKGFSAIQYR